MALIRKSDQVIDVSCFDFSTGDSFEFRNCEFVDLLEPNFPRPINFYPDSFATLRFDGCVFKTSLFVSNKVRLFLADSRFTSSWQLFVQGATSSEIKIHRSYLYRISIEDSHITHLSLDSFVDLDLAVTGSRLTTLKVDELETTSSKLYFEMDGISEISYLSESYPVFVSKLDGNIFFLNNIKRILEYLEAHEEIEAIDDRILEHKIQNERRWLNKCVYAAQISKNSQNIVACIFIFSIIFGVVLFAWSAANDFNNASRFFDQILIFIPVLCYLARQYLIGFSSKQRRSNHIELNVTLMVFLIWCLALTYLQVRNNQRMSLKKSFNSLLIFDNRSRIVSLANLRESSHRFKYPVDGINFWAFLINKNINIDLQKIDSKRFFLISEYVILRRISTRFGVGWITEKDLSKRLDGISYVEHQKVGSEDSLEWVVLCNKNFHLREILPEISNCYMRIPRGTVVSHLWEEKSKVYSGPINYIHPVNKSYFSDLVASLSDINYYLDSGDYKHISSLASSYLFKSPYGTFRIKISYVPLDKIPEVVNSKYAASYLYAYNEPERAPFYSLGFIFEISTEEDFNFGSLNEMYKKFTLLPDSLFEYLREDISTDIIIEGMMEKFKSRAYD